MKAPAFRIKQARACCFLGSQALLGNPENATAKAVALQKTKGGQRISAHHSIDGGGGGGGGGQNLACQIRYQTLSEYSRPLPQGLPASLRSL